MDGKRDINRCSSQVSVRPWQLSPVLLHLLVLCMKKKPRDRKTQTRNLTTTVVSNSFVKTKQNKKYTWQHPNYKMERISNCKNILCQGLITKAAHKDLISVPFFPYKQNGETTFQQKRINLEIPHSLQFRICVVTQGLHWQQTSLTWLTW